MSAVSQCRKQQLLCRREHMNPQLTCSQHQWLHSSVGRASHRYCEVTGLNPVEVLNCFIQASLRNCIIAFTAMIISSFSSYVGSLSDHHLIITVIIQLSLRSTKLNQWVRTGCKCSPSHPIHSHTNLSEVVCGHVLLERQDLLLHQVGTAHKQHSGLHKPRAKLSYNELCQSGLQMHNIATKAWQHH